MKARGLLVALIVATAAALLIAPGSASALSLDPIGEFDSPVFVTSEPADPDRLFVVEKAGTIELLDDGVGRPFLDITDQVADDGERGLLSMAFDPDYATNKRFYAYYSDVATRSRRTTRSSGSRAVTRSGPTASATRGASPSTGSAAIS